MLKAFGLAFISLLGGAGITLVGVLLGGDFSVDYAKGSSIEVLATVLALNMATATFLVGGLLNMEERANRDGLFDRARREIRHNLYVMMGLFIVNILVVALITDKNGHIPTTQIELNQCFGAIVIAILLFYIYLLREIMSSTFKIRSSGKS